MFDFAICQISGKQYKLVPNKPFVVDWQGKETKKVEVPVMLLSEGGKIKIGTPYLKDKLTLEILESVRGNKIRVAKFHAKANYRRVSGIRPKKTKLVYTVKNTA